MGEFYVLLPDESGVPMVISDAFFLAPVPRPHLTDLTIQLFL
jgi:hypothetical protein